MQPDKAQLDTIEMYLRTLASEDKIRELMKELEKTDSQRAQELIVLFEQRTAMKVPDIERIIKKGR